MTDLEPHRLQARGRMAELQDDIRILTRARSNLVRPLSERLCRYRQAGLAGRLDCQTARDELAAVERAEAALAEAVDDYNRLATGLGLPGLKRRGY